LQEQISGLEEALKAFIFYQLLVNADDVALKVINRSFRRDSWIVDGCPVSCKTLSQYELQREACAGRVTPSDVNVHLGGAPVTLYSVKIVR